MTLRDIGTTILDTDLSDMGLFSLGRDGLAHRRRTLAILRRLPSPGAGAKERD